MGRNSAEEALNHGPLGPQHCIMVGASSTGKTTHYRIFRNTLEGPLGSFMSYISNTSGHHEPLNISIKVGGDELTLSIDPYIIRLDTILGRGRLVVIDYPGHIHPAVRNMLRIISQSVDSSTADLRGLARVVSGIIEAWSRGDNISLNLFRNLLKPRIIEQVYVEGLRRFLKRECGVEREHGGDFHRALEEVLKLLKLGEILGEIGEYNRRLPIGGVLNVYVYRATKTILERLEELGCEGLRGAINIINEILGRINMGAGRVVIEEGEYEANDAARLLASLELVMAPAASAILVGGALSSKCIMLLHPVDFKIYLAKLIEKHVGSAVGDARNELSSFLGVLKGLAEAISKHCKGDPCDSWNLQEELEDLLKGFGRDLRSRSITDLLKSNPALGALAYEPLPSGSGNEDIHDIEALRALTGVNLEGKEYERFTKYLEDPDSGNVGEEILRIIGEAKRLYKIYLDRDDGIIKRIHQDFIRYLLEIIRRAGLSVGRRYLIVVLSFLDQIVNNSNNFSITVVKVKRFLGELNTSEGLTALENSWQLHQLLSKHGLKGLDFRPLYTGARGLLNAFSEVYVVPGGPVSREGRPGENILLGLYLVQVLLSSTGVDVRAIPGGLF